MDLLFKRYASPFSFIDQYLRSGCFDEFVEQFVDTINKERKHKHNWEFYLHRVLDKSYDEFIEAIEVEQENQNMTEADIETTIKNSRNILANFNPEERGEN